MKAKFIFAHPSGYYLKKVTRNGNTTQTVLTLCEEPDLRSLSLSEVKDPKEFFICTLKNGTPVYLINLKEPPKGSQFARLVKLDDCTWESYFTLTCVESKIALVRLSKIETGDTSTIWVCLATIEKIFGRGRAGSWATITEEKENVSSLTDGEKS